MRLNSKVTYLMAWQKTWQASTASRLQPDFCLWLLSRLTVREKRRQSLDSSCLRGMHKWQTGKISWVRPQNQPRCQKIHQRQNIALDRIWLKNHQFWISHSDEILSSHSLTWLQRTRLTWDYNIWLGYHSRTWRLLLLQSSTLPLNLQTSNE